MLQNRAVRLRSGDLVRQHVIQRLKLIDSRLGNDAARQQLHGAVEFHLCIVAFGLERLDAGVGGRKLQRQLVVHHRRDDIACLHRATFFNGECRDRTADARAGWHQVTALDLAEHGLQVGAFGDADRNFAGLGHAGQPPASIPLPVSSSA